MAARVHYRRWAWAALLVVMAVLLLLAGLATSSSDGDISFEVRYATEEECRWLDSLAAKYRSASGPGGPSIQRATDEESAILNRMAGGHFSDGRSPAGGFDGHLEFDEDHPFGRVVVDAVHPAAGGSSDTKMDDDMENQQRSNHSHAKGGAQDL